MAALEAHLATLKETTARAEADAARERERADGERNRADKERERADAERARADEIQRRLGNAIKDEAAEHANMRRQLEDLSAVVEQMRRPWWKRLASGR